MTRTEEAAALVAAAPEGLQARDVAQALGMSQKTARKTLGRAIPLGIVAIRAARLSVWTTVERRDEIAAKLHERVKGNERAWRRAYMRASRSAARVPIWQRVPNSVWALGAAS